MNATNDHATVQLNVEIILESLNVSVQKDSSAIRSQQVAVIQKNAYPMPIVLIQRLVKTLVVEIHAIHLLLVAKMRCVLPVVIELIANALKIPAAIQALNVLSSNAVIIMTVPCRSLALTLNA